MKYTLPTLNQTSNNQHQADIKTLQNYLYLYPTKYDPWGEIKQGGTKSKFLYTGQEKDLETGLNYYNFRYYDSRIRRFTQPDDVIQDWYDPQSLNRYSYVKNNPLRYKDPSGHNPLALTNPVVLAGSALIFGYYYVTNPTVRNATNDLIISGAKNIATTISALLNKTQPKPISVSPPSSNTSPQNKPTANTTPSGGTPSGGSPQAPKQNPFERIAPLLPQLVNEGGNKWKSNVTIDQGLNAAETWLGNGYKELKPWVFRSADNLRQFRMKDVDILDKNPHFNFETVGEDGKKLLDNLHIYLIDINK